MGNMCERVQDNLWGLYIWNICGKYLCELKIVYRLVWVYIFVSGLMKLGPKNLYLNISPPPVTCEQFLLGHTCEFEILVAVVSSGLLQFFPHSTLLVIP